jgi:hypothetical protein
MVIVISIYTCRHDLDLQSVQFVSRLRHWVSHQPYHSLGRISILSPPKQRSVRYSSHNAYIRCMATAEQRDYIRHTSRTHTRIDIAVLTRPRLHFGAALQIPTVPILYPAPAASFPRFFRPPKQAQPLGHAALCSHLDTRCNSDIFLLLTSDNRLVLQRHLQRLASFETTKPS